MSDSSANITGNQVAIPLRQLQADFKNYLLHKEGAIAVHIAGSASLSNDARLAIYANAYTARLIEVLEKDFTALHAVLGEEAFAALALDYIRQHPSTTPSLRWFGRHMADFLRGHSQHQSRSDLIELAIFEWAFTDAFDAADVPIVTVQTMAQVPGENWPQLCFKFHPSVQAFQYQWNIVPVWQALQQQQSIPAAQRLTQRHTCLVWRDSLNTHYRTLDDDEAIALVCAMEGGTFAQICEVLMEYVEDESQIALRAASLLKGWIEAGLISQLN